MAPTLRETADILSTCGAHNLSDDACINLAASLTRAGFALTATTPYPPGRVTVDVDTLLWPVANPIHCDHPMTFRNNRTSWTGTHGTGSETQTTTYACTVCTATLTITLTSPS